MNNKYKKIIFLDIDGCLNSQESNYLACTEMNHPRIIDRYETDGDKIDHVDRVLLGYLHRIIQKTDAKVVIVSSWVTREDQLAPLSELLGLPIIGKTDYTGGGTGRGHAVLRWINEHQPDRFIIIDDGGHSMYHCQDDSDNKKLWTNMIYCHGAYGLQRSDIPKAIYHLNGGKTDYLPLIVMVLVLVFGVLVWYGVYEVSIMIFYAFMELLEGISS